MALFWESWSPSVGHVEFKSAFSIQRQGWVLLFGPAMVLLFVQTLKGGDSASPEVSAYCKCIFIVASAHIQVRSV